MATEERLKKEIIRLETVDPGTGAIRLDKAANKQVTGIIEITNAASSIEIMRLDIPYFGVYNNHYDYATADEMMKQMTGILKRFTRGVIIRDGGNLFSVREALEGERDIALLKEEMNTLLAEYTAPEDENKKSAMENEVMVKKAITRQEDVFGEVRLFDFKLVGISEDTTLSDVVRLAL